jgi:hypothetical protein
MAKAKKKPEFFTWLRSGLRGLSRKHTPIYEALAAAKRPYFGNNPRQKICYLCAKCQNTFSSKEVAVDHRLDAGALKSWDDISGFMQRLFCGREGLDILCHDCHDCKTYATKYGVTEEQALFEKELIAIMKHPVKEVVDFIAAHDYNNEYAVTNAVNRKAAVRLILESVY